MSIKIVAFLLLSCNYCTYLAAQSLQVKEFTQIFQPSLSVGGEWTLPRPMRSGDAELYNALAVGVQASVPIKGEIEFDLNLDKLKNWKNIKSWKDVQNIGRTLPVDVSGYQLFWTANGGFRSTTLSTSTDSSAHRGYYFNTGMMGLHLQRKFRLLFYQATLGFSEDGTTMRQLKPIFTAMGGQARIIKYGFILYYGGYINYTDGRLLPIPFIGAYTALPPFFDLQITLPLQARISYRKHKNLRASAEIALSGFQTGFSRPNPLTAEAERLGMRSAHLKVSTTAEHRTEGGRLGIELGTVLARSISLFDGGQKISDFKPKTGMYVSVNYQVTLQRKSLIKNIWDKLEFKW